MKKPYLFLIAAVLLTMGCKKEQQDYAVVEFDLSKIAGKIIIISGDDFNYRREFNEEDNSINYVDTLNITEGGYFSLSLNQQGFKFFLEKGANLKISASADDLMETLSFDGDFADENNYLVYNEILQKTISYELQEDDFVTQLGSYESKAAERLSSGSMCREFREREQKEILYEVTTRKLLYPKVHSRITGKENFNVSVDFYSDLSKMNFADTVAYRNSVLYSVTVRSYFDKMAMDSSSKHSNSELLAYIREVDRAIPKGSVKDELLYIRLRMGMNLNNDLEEVHQAYIGALQDEEYIKIANQEFEGLQALASGKPAPQFVLENYFGGQTALQDFRGKNVFIDLWATWCGPCIKEFPALEKLAEEFQDDVHFVYISIDRKRDYETWRKMVKDENLPGTQLIAYNENEEFKNSYAIRGIPRYILIDKDGAIVSANTFHPSDTKLRELLTSL